MGRVYLSLLSKQADRLAQAADAVRRVVVLLAPLPPTLGDVLVRRWEYLHLGYYHAAARAAVWNLDVDWREEVYRCVPPCLMGLFRTHMFYHTEEKVHEDGVEWDGVVYCMDLCKWGND